MDNRELNMNFEVATDLKNKNDKYSVEIALEKPVGNTAREAAMALTGAIVRNNNKRIYGDTMDDVRLAEHVIEQLNSIIGRVNEDFKIKRVNLSHANKFTR